MEEEVSRYHLDKRWRLQERCICDKGASMEAQSCVHELEELAGMKNIL